MASTRTPAQRDRLIANVLWGVAGVLALLIVILFVTREDSQNTSGLGGISEFEIITVPAR